MANERLRALLLERQVTPAKLSEAVQVDPKTIERWIVAGRVPYRRHRYAVAAFFGVDESYIWPDALDRDEVIAASESEIIAVYPHRWSVPRDAWRHLFEQAEHEIGILVYAATFMAEDSELRRMLGDKAKSGVRIRILLGDPDSPVVVGRGNDEGIDDAIAGKVRNAIILFRSLAKLDNVEIRLHGTTLYNSIYRADEQLLVNTHIYGMMANNAPAFHLRRIPGGDMVSTYLESFERVWERATPYEGT
jgi:lambda repressor-like predicted transcriptional regulator